MTEQQLRRSIIAAVKKVQITNPVMESDSDQEKNSTLFFPGEKLLWR